MPDPPPASANKQPLRNVAVVGPGASKRWLKKASSLGRAFEIIALVVLGGAAVYVFRGNPVLVFGLVIGDLLILGIRLLSRSSTYELVIDDKEIAWGWVGVRAKDGEHGYRFLESIRFYKRGNGTGAIELTFENGACAILPSEFTDQAGVSDEVLSKLREVLPHVPITVL